MIGSSPITVLGGSSSSGGGGGNSFSTIQTPAGTSPVASGPNDTLTLADDGNITITGNAGTDTVTFGLSPTINQEETFATRYTALTSAGADPNISDGAGVDGSPYNPGDILTYKVYSYIFVNGQITLSDNAIDFGTYTVVNSGGINLNFSADSNPSIAGYYLIKTVNGASPTGGDLGTYSEIFPDEPNTHTDSPVPNTGYTTSVIIPHKVSDSTIYGVYSPNEPIFAKAIVLPAPLAVTLGGTGSGDGTLKDTQPVVAVDFYNRYLRDAAGAFSLKWDIRILFDGTAVTSINYQTRNIYNDLGNVALSYAQAISITPYTNSFPGLLIKGAASQSADLLLLQDSGSSIKAAIDQNGVIRFRAGTTSSNSLAKVGGTIADHFVNQGSTSTAETTLYSDSIAASTLANNGDKLTSNYGLVLANSTSTKDIRLYFGTTAVIFDSGALTTSASAMISVNAMIIRDSTSTIRYWVNAVASGTNVLSLCSVGKVTGVTLSNAFNLKITGQAGGAGVANNDIQALNGFVEFKPAF